MAWVADYTARIAPSAMPADLAGSCRYISRYTWKVVSASEFREIEASGRRCVLNFEDAANDWLQAHRPGHRGAAPEEAHRWMLGASAGSSDADFAVAAARKVGYPAGRPIPGSCDIDMTRSQWTGAGKAYALAWRDGLVAGGYGPGVYGPSDVLGWVRDEVGGYVFYWQAGMSTAWSGGRNRNLWPGAHLRQRRHATIGGQDVDYNDIVRPDWADGTGMKRDDMLKDEIIPNTDSTGHGNRDGATVLAEIFNHVTGQYAWPESPLSKVAGFTSAIAASQAREAAILAAVQALATGGANVETAAIVSAINEAADRASENVRQLMLQQLDAAGHALEQ